MAAVLDLVRVLFEPAKVFERVREKPTFFVPVVAIIVVSIGVGDSTYGLVRAVVNGVPIGDFPSTRTSWASPSAFRP